MMKAEKIAFLESFYAVAGYPADAKIFSEFLGETVDVSELREVSAKNSEDQKWREKYISRARFWLPFLRFVPGIRGAALCNSLTFGGGGQKSDIDLFLITAENRLWTARIFTTIFFQFFGVRRHGTKIAGRLCLSFFLDETALDFQKIAISPRDPYLAMWISAILPMFGKEVFSKFADKNRKFVQKNTPIRIRFEKNLESVPSQKSGKNTRFGDFVENFFKKIFLPRTQRKAESLVDKSGTIISDHILKFHNSDRREIFAEKVNTFSSS